MAILTDQIGENQASPFLASMRYPIHLLRESYRFRKVRQQHCLLHPASPLPFLGFQHGTS